MSRGLNLALTLFARDNASKVLKKTLQDTVKQTADAAKASEKLGDTDSKSAEKGIKASRSLQAELKRQASARSTLGVRSEQDIQREIQQTQAAYLRLTRSGVMSANEQGRAFSAMTDKVSRLKNELNGANHSMTGLQRARMLGSGAAAVVGGITAASAVLAQPVRNQMSYDRRISMMANTAYAERGVEGRLEGKKELGGLVRNAVTAGGGTKESAADTLDAMLASGAVSMDSVKTLLPVIQKYATATGADPKDLANIAIRLKQTFDVKDEDIGKALNMAIVAGQEGSFELADMAKYLPGQLASASSAGMRGLDDFSTLLALNQTSAITAGNSDEAGNNTANLLAKLNSRDTSMALAKIKYNGKGIDLPGSLAHAKEKGINSVDAFVGIVDKVVSGDKKYQELQNQLRNTKGGERAQILESMAKILEGSSVGKVIADQQALKALIGYRANRDYAKDVVNKSNEQRNLNAGESAGDINFSVMSNANDVKAEQFNNAKDFAEMDAIKPLSDILGTLSKNLTDYSKEYPGLTTAVVGATDGIKAMGAAAAAFAGLRFLMGGGGAGPAGNGGISAPGTLGKMAGNSIAVPLLYITAGSVAISTVRDALREDFAKKNMSEKVDSISTGTSGYSFVDLAWSVVKDRFSKKGSSISVPSNITTADVNPFNAQANNLASFGVPSYLSAGQQGQRNQPIQVTTKLEVDGRVLAEIVNDHNGAQAVRGPTGSPQ
ncbi:TPA: phage tail tape measure protein [Yersinia enterocolitica]|uniref:phage tail tape measure protein n=1 Tax=Yersinia enterocolitica TaxID=630 RepID=UPI0005DC4ED6|nr:phage tail tape measure protein [Yersinia enterocolitica]EKN3386806.1 phage tail tape measure protein [Yersinia enterocolitica]EKN3766503.1 phage tail tape measure protein [Yersinia enterocolitica]EKN4083096.1 phage tail tape measure protein [Yersinia enterocolitica]EKN6167133.1 phage tail tape measure protein [Yersinia enterocolitica]EKN6397023.1 phage tail tape measure protein [Yersinia enterocolitica]